MQKITGEIMLGFLKTIYYEALLFTANRLVTLVPFHIIRLFFYRHIMKFQIGRHSYIFMNAWFDTKGKGYLCIGNNSIINERCRLDNRGGLFIGSNVSISSEVCILTADHDLNSASFVGRQKPVHIDDFVFVGTRAIILPGVTLHKGSAVAAGAIVTKDVAEGVIVAGSPAKPIGQRNTAELCYTPRYDRWFH